MEMLIKGIDYGFKDVDAKSGIVCGYFAHFGSKDSAGDVIEKGAFIESITKNGPNGTGLIKHLLDHDKKNAVAVLKVLEEDNVGLYYEAKAGRHTNGRDFLLMVEDGIINQHSFGYIVESERKSADFNLLQKLDILEGSSLQFRGCNSNTPITGLKSLQDVMSELTTLENALKNGSYTDETFIKIREKVNVIYTLLQTDDAKESLFRLMRREAELNVNN